MVICRVFFALKPAMDMYAAGRVTGTVVDIGGSMVSVVPVEEGFPVPDAFEVNDIAGDALTSFMTDLLHAKTDQTFTTPSRVEIAKDIKEQGCYVAKRFDLESEANCKSTKNTIKYTLPDKQELDISGSVRI